MSGICFRCFCSSRRFVFVLAAVLGCGAGLNAEEPAAGGSAPGAATKAKPFINTLGMKFVPVPGAKVLFGVWETRVKDYRAFAQAASGTVDGRWEKPGFAQTEESPVVNVSWDDARTFCAWLSKKEGRTYRLPTDREWSAAVGMGPELEIDKTPASREGRQPGLFPWGKKWPPAKNTGNFAPSLGVDAFAKTSPVGSFAANIFGIHDLDGNVTEWCEDKFKSEGGDRTLRGSDWGQSFEDLLRSDRRGFGPPTQRSIQEGFRCVLAL